MSNSTGHRQEALPPGRLQRNLPRELETICLKCLEKEPANGTPPRRTWPTTFAGSWRIGRSWPGGSAGGMALALVPARAGQGRIGRRPHGCRDHRFFGESPRNGVEAPEKAQAGSSGARPCRECRKSGAGESLLQPDRPVAARVAAQYVLLAPDNFWTCANPVVGVGNGTTSAISTRPSSARSTSPSCLTSTAVAFSRDGSRFAFAAYNAYEGSKGQVPYPIEVWETFSWPHLSRFAGSGPTLRLSFHPDGRQLASSGTYGAQLWDLESGKPVHEWLSSASLTFNPDGTTLVAREDGRVVFFEPTTGARIREFPAAPGRVTYRPDGRVVAVSGPEAVELLDTRGPAA